MDLIRKAIEYSDYAENHIGSQRIVKGRVPWVGCTQQGYAEEKVGSSMEEKIREKDNIQWELDFFNGGNIENGPCHDKCGQSVCCLLKNFHHLSHCFQMYYAG